MADAATLSRRAENAAPRHRLLARRAPSEPRGTAGHQSPSKVPQAAAATTRRSREADPLAQSPLSVDAARVECVFPLSAKEVLASSLVVSC